MQQFQVNLLPLQYRPRPNFRLVPVVIAVVLLLNILGMATFGVLLYMDTATLKGELNILKAGVNSLERQVGEEEAAAQLKAQVEEKERYIARVRADYCLWHPLLAAIERAMEPGVVLGGIGMARGGNVTLGGTADSIAAVANMLGSLQQETGLSKVHFHNAAPGGLFQITLAGWQGPREEAGDD